MVGGFYDLCRLRSVVGFFAFSLVGGYFLFSRMVGGRCFNQYLFVGRWLIVDGLWSVASRSSMILYYAVLIDPLEYN